MGEKLGSGVMLPDLANKNTRCLFEFDFQINDE
jgi:hypothetical protein